MYDNAQSMCYKIMSMNLSEADILATLLPRFTLPQLEFTDEDVLLAIHPDYVNQIDTVYVNPDKNVPIRQFKKQNKRQTLQP